MRSFDFALRATLKMTMMAVILAESGWLYEMVYIY